MLVLPMTFPSASETSIRPLRSTGSPRALSSCSRIFHYWDNLQPKINRALSLGPPDLCCLLVSELPLGIEGPHQLCHGVPYTVQDPRLTDLAIAVVENT